jgi:hypothetical protein
MTKKPTRPSLGGALGKRVALKGDEPQAAPEAMPFIPRASKQRGRGVLVRTNLAGWQALRMMAYEQGRTLNDIGVEAFQDLLRKHGRPVVLDKPEE